MDRDLTPYEDYMIMLLVLRQRDHGSRFTLLVTL